ncbi:MAG: branched-chain amino acid ABC transporter permease [Firmicutes bacterium]|nr:branched-chain amino acid ABC transporter permease [Bacillota bacterium]
MADKKLRPDGRKGLFKSILGNTYRKEAFISYAILIGGYALMQALTAAGMISRNLQGQFVPICVYVSLAVSLNLVVGISGELSLGHAGFMAVGAFSGILIARLLAVSMDNQVIIVLAALIFGGIMASIAGFIIGIPILGLRGDYLAIVTLAFGEIIRNLVNVLYFGLDDEGHLLFAFNHTIEGIETNQRIITGAIGATGTTTMANFTWGVMLCLFTVFVVLNLKNSRQGRAIMSIRDNRIAGESIGLSVRKYKLMAFVISAALAGMAGALFGLNYSTMVPTKFSFNMSVLILVFVVLGGVGNIWGGMIAATLLTVLPETFRQFADYRMLTYAIVLILVMIFTYNPKIRYFMKSNAEKLFRRKKPQAEGTGGGD